MLHGIGRPTTGRLVIPGMYIESPADHFVERMEEEENPLARAAMAFQAIQLDYGCMKARLVLAVHHAARPERRLHHLQVAVQTGACGMRLDGIRHQHLRNRLLPLEHARGRRVVLIDRPVHSSSRRCRASRPAHTRPPASP